MPPSPTPVWERRAWAASFPGLSPPGEAEEWAEEAYLLPIGLGGRNIKVRGDALEIKDLLVEREDMQLWRGAARLPFPIPSATVERELIVRLALCQPLSRERYTADQLLGELLGPRHGNVAVVRLRKRRRLFEAAGGCRAEVGEVELDGRRILTACAEHADPDRLRRAAAELGLDRYPNLDYPSALARLTGSPRRAA